MSAEGPQWMTRQTLGQSKPIPKAAVAMTMCICELLVQKDCKISFFTDVVVQAQNISTIPNLTRSTSQQYAGNVDEQLENEICEGQYHFAFVSLEALLTDSRW